MHATISPFSKTVSVTTLAVTLLLTGCATVPPSTTIAPLTSASLASAQSLKGEAGTWPADHWWLGFNDPQLNSLIDEALNHSPDLLAAQARLDKATALNEQIKASLEPNATLNASTGVTKQSLNNGFPPDFAKYLPRGYKNTTKVTLDANYSLDLWGKSRAALKGTISNAKAAQLDATVIRQSLAGAIAHAYVELDRLYDERDAIAEIKRGSDIQLQLVQARAEHHLDSQDTVLKAQDEQAQLISRLANIDGAVRLQQNLIAALTGAGPDRGLTITRPKLAPVQVSALPEDAHINLLGRRPDVQAARLRIEAMNQQITYTRADFYPDVKLNAYYGIQNLGLPLGKEFTTKHSDIGGLMPAVSLPIFEGGRLRAAYRASEADYNAAVSSYDKTLIDALHQVADAAVNTQTTTAKLAAANDRRDTAQKSYDLAKARFAKGLATKMDVLSAHVGLVMVELDISDLKAQAYNDRITFIAALGGGFQSE